MQYTVKELEALPTITQTQTSDLKIQTDDERVWLERTTVADGEPYDHKITVEWFRDGKWVTVHEYPG